MRTHSALGGIAAQLALIVALAVAAAAPADGRTNLVSWDGCTPRVGDVRFTAADGTRLVGHRFGSGRTAVVLAHETRGSLCQWVAYAKRLASLGYLAFPFDFRNYGDSQDRAYPANQRWGGDVAAAVKAVRARGASKVFVIGASLGGSAAVQAAANIRPQLAGVISVSGAADLAGAIAAARRLRVSVLYLAGALDKPFDEDARRLFDATASTDKTLTVVDRGEHGVQLVAHSAEARNGIESFLAGH